MGEITRLTATFDGYEPNSPSYLACDMAKTGENLKSLLETGAPLFGFLGPEAPATTTVPA